MALVRIHNETRGADLAERARWADRFWSRLRGLLGRKSLAQGEGVVVVPCSSVHTFFLPFPIDIVYLDGERTVVKTVSDFKPFRACAGGRGMPGCGPCQVTEGGSWGTFCPPAEDRLRWSLPWPCRSCSPCFLSSSMVAWASAAGSSSPTLRAKGRGWER